MNAPDRRIGAHSRGLGIIADDLTGAMDTGVQFAKSGLETVVMLAEGEPPPAEMVVVSTDSRDIPPRDAYWRVRRAARLLADRAIYKKIDSTLRGNLGPELDGVMDELGLTHALVAPAFPANGRTTMGGYHLVHGVPLSASSFANDPLWPASESHLPTLLARQTARSVGHLPLATIEEGIEAVLEALSAQSAAVVAADATTADHLHTLAVAVARLEGWLPCGSAGLAGQWPRALGVERPAAELRWTAETAPALVVAGSRNSATAEQLRRAAAEGHLALLCPSGDGSDSAEVVARAAEELARQRSVAITTTFSTYREGETSTTAAALAAMAAELLARYRVAGLFLTGGDIARAVALRLGARALRALGEVQPGVPAGELVGGPHHGLRVVTKAGGFGDDRAIIDAVAFLKGESG